MLCGVFNQALRTENNSQSVTDQHRDLPMQAVTNGYLFEIRS